ncbi:fimbrillin family protein [uncultured Parabacteroides sp.]|uniref:fimbrillin family protein n=1 Tax=uncultured Parabacteroides sp. TaxID=512312 RepID=UPI0025FFB90D|nr:fimbrillin family protein [uncultured Parabacteroides sp.]
MKQTDFWIRMLWVWLAGLAGLTACTDEMDDAGIVLRPAIYTGTQTTRSIVNGIAFSAANGNINAVKLYVTQYADNAVYPGVSSGLSTFTYDGTIWTGDPVVKLSNIEARIYAFHPTGLAVTNKANADTHTVPVTVSAEQKFSGDNTWECEQADYLYGSSSDQVGTAGEIKAKNTEKNYSPTIHMQHALAQVVFQLQTVSGRPVDDTYDYVKRITLATTTGSDKMYFQTGTGTMQLKDGALGSLTAGNTLTFVPSTANFAVKCGANTSPAIVAYGLVAPMTATPDASSLTLTILLGKPTATDGERELTVTIPSPVKWERGRRYLYTLNLSNRDVTVDGTTTITDWSTPEGWNGNQDMNPDGF